MKNAKGAVLSAPLEGTLYAIELVPSLLNTQGGPRRNVKGQVLNAYGEVIPGLYVAGEMGSMWGHIYQAPATTPKRWSSAPGRQGRRG